MPDVWWLCLCLMLWSNIAPIHSLTRKWSWEEKQCAKLCMVTQCHEKTRAFNSCSGHGDRTRWSPSMSSPCSMLPRPRGGRTWGGHRVGCRFSNYLSKRLFGLINSDFTLFFSLPPLWKFPLHSIELRKTQESNMANEVRVYFQIIYLCMCARVCWSHGQLSHGAGGPNPSPRAELAPQLRGLPWWFTHFLWTVCVLVFSPAWPQQVEIIFQHIRSA